MSREVDIFADALELDRSERAAFLDRACQGDGALRARIEALLTGHDEAAQFLHKPAAPSCALRTEEEPGAVLGRYTLREKIGEGGCGAVWVADQSEPVKRRVALKVIKLGMDTREVVARFEAERQVLALMDHPNIAKVFDAGATATGRPFFVMELVRGTAITRFCDDRKLSTRARLELFIEVCHAIQHAHQKGIIHRDIKPSNVLVTLHDDKLVPMVIDFGIAKATQGRLTDQTLFTAFEQFIGTPTYMSPEQAEHNALDVDTRSDIYSLGVLLYELLTGRPPFDPKTLHEAGLEQMRRIIREAEPPRPSARVRTLDDAQRSTVARLHSTAPAQLSTLLRGDLDWILLKALEKNRVRRYQTANAFAADIQRSLAHEVVIARPPSTAYRMRQFIARHTVGFAAATTAAVLLMAGLTGLAISLVREKAARELAVEAQRLATKRAAQVDFVLGSRLLDEGKVADGLAYLVSAARKDPENQVIAPRLLSTLVSRNFLLPEGKPLVMPSPVASAVWPSGGRRIFVLGEDKILRTINADTWQIEHEFQFAGKVAYWARQKRVLICAPRFWTTTPSRWEMRRRVG